MTNDETEAAQPAPPLAAEAATDVETPMPQTAPPPEAVPDAAAQPQPQPAGAGLSDYREGDRVYLATDSIAPKGRIWEVRTHRFGRSRIRAETRAEAETLYREVNQVPDDDKLADINSKRVQ